jgi:xanthine dehydrogenase accessory factor
MDAPEADVLAAAVDARRQGRAAVLVTVTRTRGSTPRKEAAKMLVFADTSVGTIGGGRIELEATEAARMLLAEGYAARATSRSWQLTADLAMCCGGEMEVFMEPMLPSPRLFICGGGHVGRALVPIAAALGFVVHVVDDLEENQDPARYPQAKGFCDDFDPARWQPALSDEDYVVVVTRDHAIDQRIMESLLGRPRAYLGLIGSKRKIAMFKERTRARGITVEAWNDVHAPIGLDIGADTPEEIAVAIAAELVRVRAARRPKR